MVLSVLTAVRTVAEPLVVGSNQTNQANQVGNAHCCPRLGTQLPATLAGTDLNRPANLLFSWDANMDGEPMSFNVGSHVTINSEPDQLP